MSGSRSIYKGYGETQASSDLSRQPAGVDPHFDRLNSPADQRFSRVRLSELDVELFVVDRPRRRRQLDHFSTSLGVGVRPTRYRELIWHL
jgi:hypothetical protein